MKKLSIFTTVLLIPLLACDSSPELDLENFVSRSNNPGYASRPTLNTWPASDQQQVRFADNLMASNYYLVLDGSGSMSESRCSGGKSKMQAAKSAVATFTQQIPSSANLGLFVFDNGGTNERVALAPNNQAMMLNAINQVVANGGTPLKTAIEQAYRALELQAKKQLGYGEYHLVVITDGEASSSQNPEAIVDTILEKSPVVLHTIGFCIEGGHSLNQAGRVDYKQANDPASLTQGLQDVLAESPAFQQDAFEG